MWERNLQYYFVRKCNVNVGNLFICVANILKNMKCERGSRKFAQCGVLHFILFIVVFKVQEYSLCGRVY